MNISQADFVYECLADVRLGRIKVHGPSDTVTQETTRLLMNKMVEDRRKWMEQTLEATIQATIGLPFIERVRYMESLGLLETKCISTIEPPIGQKIGFGRYPMLIAKSALYAIEQKADKVIIGGVRYLSHNAVITVNHTTYVINANVVPLQEID